MITKLKEYSKYLLVFVIAVLIFSIFTNFTHTSKYLSDILGWITYILNKFIIGFALAYFINFMVEFFRRKLKVKKALAITISYTIVLASIAFFLLYLIPVVIDSVTSIAENFSGFYESTREIMNSTYLKLHPSIIEQLDGFTKEIGPTIYKFITNIVNVDSLQNILKSSTRLAMNIFFGFIISIYALVEKESLLRNAKLMVATILPTRKTIFTFNLLSEINKQFSKFLVGKFLDSLIIGLLSYILYSIFNIPLALFLAVVAGVTNMIPYFGPMFGAVITIPIALCFDPGSALIVSIIIIVLQTFDGMLLGPKILGDAVGISPLLTVSAITIGGDIAGFMGMLLGVPIIAVLRTMIYHKYLNSKKDKLDLIDAEINKTPPEEVKKPKKKSNKK